MKQQKLGAAFRDAAQRGELHVMHMLTREGLCDVECPDEEGNSALLLACATGDVVVLRYLEQMGANLQAKNNLGWSAMHQACFHGQEDIVRVLMELTPELVNVCNSNGSSPLHTAVANGQYDVIRYLLVDRRANIDGQNNTGDTPLHFAVVCQQPEIAALLIEYGARPAVMNDQNQTPIDDAIATGQGDVLSMMLSSTIRLTEDDSHMDTTILDEAREGHRKQGSTRSNKKRQAEKKKKNGRPYDVTFAHPVSDSKGSSKRLRRGRRRKAKGRKNDVKFVPRGTEGKRGKKGKRGKRGKRGNN